MKFFYNGKVKEQIRELNEIEEREFYYTKEMIQRIPVYPWTKELEQEWLSGHSNLWPVEPAGFSWERFADCKNIEEAREEMFYAFNNSLYEYYHDL
jgi:hypothetical protein